MPRCRPSPEQANISYPGIVTLQKGRGPNYTHVSLDLSDVKQMSGADGVDKVLKICVLAFYTHKSDKNANTYLYCYYALSYPMTPSCFLNLILSDFFRFITNN